MPLIEVLRSGLLALLALGLIVVVVMLCFYPYTVARRLGHPHKDAIFLLCFLGGASGIGWIIALVWAYSPGTAAKPLQSMAGVYIRCGTCNVGFRVPREATATRCPNCDAFLHLETPPPAARGAGPWLADEEPFTHKEPGVPGLRPISSRADELAAYQAWRAAQPTPRPLAIHAPPPPDVDELLADSEFERWRAAQRRHSG